jgi:hypothetical protein
LSPDNASPSGPNIDLLKLEDEIGQLLKQKRKKEAVQRYMAVTGEKKERAEHTVKRLAMLSGLKTGACFIATACYGEDAPEVMALRRFRDERLLSLAVGRALVRAYYLLSPALAGWLKGRPWGQRLVRSFLLGPLLRAVRRL